MKILKLRFKNLNSLYGEWLIDFTNLEYTSNGIFALTGPTGAGKSTILDAICLALYGATPRLGRITKAGNEIMSRQTGECYSEVLFESQAGQFLCHWEQRRARKKSAGKLQDQEHQIADANTGKIIASKKSEVVSVIEQKTGMDFDRFTRSVLLAQGGFDTFLKAEVEQKSKILEQITGTEIYSEISRRVHERQRCEQNNLELLKREIADIKLLENEEIKQINFDLDSKQKRVNALVGELAAVNKAITWLTNIASIRQEIQGFTAELTNLNLDFQAFKPERSKLEQANKAAMFEARYQGLKSVRSNQTDDQNALLSYETKLPQVKSLFDEQAKAVKKAEQLSLKAKNDLQSTAPLIQEIRLIDQKITAQQKLLDNTYTAYKLESAVIKDYEQTQKKIRNDCLLIEEKLAIVNLYIDNNAGDIWLVSGLAGLEEQVNNLLCLQKDIVAKENKFKEINKNLSDINHNLAKISAKSLLDKEQLKFAKQNCNSVKEAINKLLNGRLLREYRAEKDSLLREMAFVRKIEELETYRARLIDGSECPLCGSKDHPYVHGNIPVPDALEQKIDNLNKTINKAEEYELQNQKYEQLLAQAQNNLNESKKLETNAINDKRLVTKLADDLSQSMSILENNYKDLKQKIVMKIEPLGLTYADLINPKDLLNLLQSRLNKWQEQQAQKFDLGNQLTNINSQIKQLDAIIDTKTKALNLELTKLQTLKNELNSIQNSRKQLYGDKNPNEEEDRLKQVISFAEIAEKQAIDKSSELQQNLSAINTQIQSLQKRLKTRAVELNQLEKDFRAALLQAGFNTENDFLSAQLAYDQRQSLSQAAKNLDYALIQLQAKQQAAERRLRIESAKNITNIDLDQLSTKFLELDNSLTNLRNEIMAIKIKIDADQRAKENLKNKQFAITQQSNECRRWDNLHELIGSADGKKYRNFAQGLTFEIMVSHANQQLSKMTDRYLLMRDANQPLELNVVDNYQAGEIRSTKNLSGGESFIISLTLALGLSKMASQKVRVDSLFLDEGFGTLDEEALDTALETLSNLQQDGKLIGIISHIPALKERISTQINIAPISGGRSNIAGPGCSKLA